MELLLKNFDHTLALAILIPLSIVGASSALRMACVICSLKPIEFLPAAAVVIVSLAANLGLRIVLQSNGYTIDLGAQVLLALLTTALIIAISVRTSVFSAMAVTITQAFLFSLMALGLNAFSQVMLT